MELSKNNKNEDVFTLFRNAQSDDEKVQIAAYYLYELSKIELIDGVELIDEEIDDLYFNTISKLRKEIIEENSNINKYKLYKAYELPKKEDYKPTEQDYYWEEYFRTSHYKKEQENKLSTIDRGIILSSLEFREFTESNGLYFNKKRIGYRVFLKFKKIWKFENSNTKKSFSESNKIPIKGSLQSLGFLFTKLIENGFIEAPKRNGNINKSATAKMILEHFEFVDRETQPNEEDIRKTLFDDNKLSADKQQLLEKLPTQNQLNTD